MYEGSSMNFNERLFKILEERGITQKELSKKSGISESTICDWKRKGKVPGIDKVLIISRVLGISLYDLISDDANQENEEGTGERSGVRSRKRSGEVSGKTSGHPGLSDHPADYVLDDTEKLLIERYRALDDGHKRRALAYFEQIYKPELPNDTDKEEKTTASDTELLQQKVLARRIRKLAKLGRITLDETQHASKLNLHLFKYLDYIGIDKLEYVKKYLASIQPFMISEIKSQEKYENAICILDECYRISLYIKVDATKGEEVVVSFHESNNRGIARRSSFIDNMSYVYVFADSIGSHVIGTENYTINLFITRGVATIPINVPASRYDEDGFLVRYVYINNAIIDVANRYLVSLTSLENDIFSNISIMIDSLIIQNTLSGKQIADSALCIYCGSLDLLDSDKQELLDTLRERYKVNSVRAIPQILERVELNLWK